MGGKWGKPWKDSVEKSAGEEERSGKQWEDSGEGLRSLCPDRREAGEPT